MDRIPQVSRQDVERVVRRDYPSELRGRVLVLLDEYQGPEPDRVKLAVLKCAAGGVDVLPSCLNYTRADHRDVIAPAEFPEFGAFMTHAMKDATLRLSPEEREEISKRDWDQYQRWLYAE
jgi:hypothetical protein